MQSMDKFSLITAFLAVWLIKTGTPTASNTPIGGDVLFSNSSNTTTTPSTPHTNHHHHDLTDNALDGLIQLDESENGTVLVKVSGLDPEESARADAEEEELEQEIEESEQELKDILAAEEEDKKEEDQEEEHKETVVVQSVEATAETPAQRQAKVKAKAVHNLMQIFGLSESSSRSPPGPAPEFMIDLYNTITDSSGVTRSPNPYGAHIMRALLERDSSLNDYFFFNMSALSLEGTESVLEAELHLFRMDTPRASLHPSLYLNPFYVLSLYQVTHPDKLNIPDLHKLLSVHYVPALGPGWQVFNVKKAVVEWLSGHSENHGLLVSAESVQGDRVPIRFARRAESEESKQPILVLFNHDSHMASLDPPPTPAPPRKRVPKRRPHPDPGTDAATLTSSQQQDLMESTTYETTTPLSSLENPRFHHSLLFQDSIRHPNSVSRFRSRRSRNNETTTANGTRHHQITTNLTSCTRHDLFVSFESIGWSSWIISPKGFNAHYCAGPCVFPLGSGVSPTNHATVQSIINELNLHPGLAQPCCVPTTLLPISLLYYDDNDNVVLKQYVDMVASGCGCR